MWQEYYQPAQVEEVLDLLDQYQARARIIAGGTDLILELEAGLRSGIEVLIDVSRIAGLDQIVLDEDNNIHLGPLVTHNHCVASKLIRECALPLAQACWQVGAPQIRNRGTIAGNLITASPANDTITPLMAMEAKVVVRSKEEERTISLEEFFKGVRKTLLKENEMLVDIVFPALQSEKQKGNFYKLGLRRAQAISVINVAAVLDFEEEKVLKARITLGSVAPTIVHATEAEEYLVGKELNVETISKASELTEKAAKPIDDLRGSAEYRKYMIGVSAGRALEAIANNTQGEDIPSDPVLLWGTKTFPEFNLAESSNFTSNQPIQTTINGKKVEFKTGHQKTLLRLIREEAGLTGTKEGCSEGECGACTVYLDGVAVMSCLVPAPRAHQAEIETVEGLSQDERLHPVQQAFIDEAAVQCGYCTPGFLMSAAKLLDEKPEPSKEDIQYAITGNLCRCTGYYKIIRAVETAGKAR
ncbi:MAG: 2Fe-2S iron-sulfur cluster binding domain-containing protein [Chloroflexi bacterium]|jgi:xanthine dehydrogenase iron-sulfur cluster and FAD-binding subunit A|nr:2Fe-2S iron-sulfur cluster binding domain-containing protein [Chloroflexota bacterium]MBT3670774.1 2Fe-2S iron-sulfur cluster binding domain-containing protein [Chloroflexota bacterium]MBT4305142.1 2Fe-2S iron-sulfur cluster binding domain-containing protein [Chloroflexota bacterium]MBT4533336.1 2Fe-2S iron-sulfur cluster binding domain-containing protein [Chloroflexota bacterium]MBT4682907.1 2Fe-2S iron-sulfur cluster binding domain-containing protein [Chloroflexota bacterium]